MPDNNYNMITPVEGLSNLASINQTKRRKKRKNRENPNQKKDKNNLLEEEDLEVEKSSKDTKYSNFGIDFKA